MNAFDSQAETSYREHPPSTSSRRRVPIIFAANRDSSENGTSPLLSWPDLSSISLADIREQLSGLPSQIRDRMYMEYCGQCSDIAPYLHNRGRRVGKQLLAALLVPRYPPDPGEVKYEDDDDASSKEKLAGLDPYLGPVLDPFVAGLTEPFQDQYKQLRTNVILTMVASSALCGVAGFFLGRYIGSSSSKKKRDSQHM